MRRCSGTPPTLTVLANFPPANPVSTLYGREKGRTRLPTTTPSITITEAHALRSTSIQTKMTRNYDILTYTLSGADAAAFTITGTVGNPGTTSPD